MAADFSSRRNVPNPTAGSDRSSYAGRRFALLTQHGKERVIAPVLEPALGCQVVRVDGYDTDALGTFTRDIPRAGTQLEAARKKARIGMELSGLALGLASEGSFGLDPFTGMLPWNVEFLILIDDEQELEIVGTAQGHAVNRHLLAATWVEVQAFACQVDFPQQHLVVRPEGETDPRIRKGIAEWKELELAFFWALEVSGNGLVFIETDLRAHANFTRRAVIGLAAQNLASRLQSRCPSCGVAGFWLKEGIPGLRCGDCGMPTREIRAEVWGCVTCGHSTMNQRTDLECADPSRCDRCNP